jgi:MFS family permease
MSTAPATSGSKVNYGMRLTSNRMTLMTGVVVFALLGYSIPSNMLTPLLVELQVAYNISAVAAIWISLAALLAGAAFAPTLCRLGDDLGWKKSMAIVALACLAVGGVVAALSTQLWLLIIGRAFHGSLAELAICMGVVGIGIGMVCSAFGLIYVEDVPPEHVGRLFGISPILATGVGGSIGGAAFAAVYLVTYWSGFRGGDRAMVRRPAIEGAEPVSVAD